MADRLFTSKQSEEILDRLRFSTKLEFSTLARLAFCLSLKKVGNNVPRSLDSSTKREMKRTSFFGEDESFLKAFLFTIHGKRVDNDDDLFSRQSIIKDHIDHGCQLLDEILTVSNQDSSKFFEKLYYEIRSDSLLSDVRSQNSLIITLGINELTSQTIKIELNNTEKHVNPHLAIVGKPGGGKTQFLLKILADIRQNSNFKTNFIFFDYKGDVSQNRDFISFTKADVFRLPHQHIPINPFVLSDYSENSVLLSAREKTESFASIDKHFGPVQKGYLTDIIQLGYKAQSKQSLKYPDFREICWIAEENYEKDGRKRDTLMETLKDLAQFHLFWQRGDSEEPMDSVASKTMVIDLHELPVLKQLVAYLVIERLYKEMASLPDSKTKDGYREIRTVLVIDEAHNYLSQKNPFLEKIVREGRSKGIAVFFASQSPGDYDQPSFDFRELLEFSFIFQSDGVSSKDVQDLLACTQKTARELQTEIAKQKVFHAISKSLIDSEEITRLKIYPFFEAMKNGDYHS